MERIIYLKQTLFYAKAYTISGVSEIYSLRNEINKLASKHLFSLESYKKGVKKHLPLKNKIPIFFSKSLLLFYLKTKNNEMYYINFFEVFKICFAKKCIIIFKNGEILELDVTRKVLSNEMAKVKTISNYLNNLLW